MEGIRKLMAVYVEKGKKVFKMADAMRIFCKDMSSVISENEFYFCYKRIIIRIIYKSHRT